MKELIDLLLGYIVSNKNICKDIQETISKISSETVSEGDLLDYYDRISSEKSEETFQNELSLIYACLAKIFFDLKEDDLSKEIQEIAKTWTEIKVGSISFGVPYVIASELSTEYEDTMTSDKLGKCLKSILKEENPTEEKLSYSKTKEKINKITEGLSIPLAHYQYNIVNKEIGKCNCQVFSKTIELIYNEWKKTYKDPNNLDDNQFLNIFSFYRKVKDGKSGKIQEKEIKMEDIGAFFNAFNIGVDCSGYVTQVYAQWMLNHGKDIKEMIANIGPNKSDTKGDLCRTNAYLLREEPHSIRHIGYFFVNPKAKTPTEYTYKIKDSDGNFIKDPDTGEFKKKTVPVTKPNGKIKYKRDKALHYSPDGNKVFNSEVAEKEVRSKLKAGDLICFEHNYPKATAHYAIVEKTGINKQGQWYFCVTESTEADKTSRTGPGPEDKKTDPVDGVRHEQGYYTSIKDFIELRKSIYEFFWFCRPKAINEYYNSI